MTANTIFMNLNFIVGLILAQGIMCFNLPKRNMFALRLTASLVALILIAFFWADANLIKHIIGGSGVRWLIVFKFFMQFALTCVAVMICFNVNLWACLFCGTAAYCIQHSGYQTYSIITTLLPMELNLGMQILVLGAVYAVFIIAAYLLLVKNKINKNQTIIVNSKMQTAVALMVLVVTVCISFFGAVYASGNTWNGVNVMLIIICLFSIMTSLLGLFLEYSLFFANKIESELSVVKRMLHLKEEQYLNSKNNVDIINIKCHDLKHQVSALKDKLNTDEYKEISKAINIYDSALKTGNDALDIVLQEKNLVCVDKGIRLTCLLDGKNLSTCLESDIYSLFGNAIENAIESVELLESDKRVISITGKPNRGYLSITIENFYMGKIEFENGLPLTTKGDKDYHGYGFKSMKVLVEKYGGMLKANLAKDIFSLNILLPISQGGTDLLKA